MTIAQQQMQIQSMPQAQQPMQVQSMPQQHPGMQQYVEHVQQPPQVVQHMQQQVEQPPTETPEVMTLDGAPRATMPIISQDVVQQDVEQAMQPHHDECLPVNESKQEPVQPAGGAQEPVRPPETPGAALAAAMAVAKEQASKATAKATGGAKAKRAQT